MYNLIEMFFYSRSLKHRENGSPEYETGHVQIGLWLTTLHSALTPQEPTHGSTQRWLLHAWLSGHSALMVHSGLHAGGAPMLLGAHEQAAWPLISLHWLFGPHGEGWHGFETTGSVNNNSNHLFA